MDVIKQAKKYLKEVPSAELSRLMGIRDTNFPPLKNGQRPLTQNMAERIVAAVEGKAAPPTAKGPQGKVNKGFAKGAGAKPQKLKKPKAKNEKGSHSAFVTGDHPAWDIIDKYSAAEIAVKLDVSMETIDGIAEKGLRPGLAEAIVAAFPDFSEEHMKDVLREEALRNDGELPYLPQPADREPEEPSSAGPCRTWVDPSVKKQPDLLAQLLQVEGAVLIVPLAGLAKLRGKP